MQGVRHLVARHPRGQHCDRRHEDRTDAGDGEDQLHWNDFRQWAGDGHRLSVVRPAIIESSLRHPFPGWIDGYKVADPLIMAYAKGALPEFPGLPDSVLDVTPVDFVVNAIVTLALQGHRAGLDAVRGVQQAEWQTETPMPAGDGHRWSCQVMPLQVTYVQQLK